MAKTLDNSFIGITGEYLVAAELSKRGIIATVTLKNTKGVDILASNEGASKLVGIQVKTNHNGNSRKWLLSAKNELMTADNLFYVFVSLHLDTGERPDFFIVPAKVVAERITQGYKEFIKNGGAENKMRNFKLDDDRYREKWGILGLTKTD